MIHWQRVVWHTNTSWQWHTPWHTHRDTHTVTHTHLVVIVDSWHTHGDRRKHIIMIVNEVFRHTTTNTGTSKSLRVKWVEEFLKRLKHRLLQVFRVTERHVTVLQWCQRGSVSVSAMINHAKLGGLNSIMWNKLENVHLTQWKCHTISLKCVMLTRCCRTLNRNWTTSSCRSRFLDPKKYPYDLHIHRGSSVRV